jgi:hypothetical protein
VGTGSSIPGVKQQGREADLSPPSSAEVCGIVLNCITNVPKSLIIIIFFYADSAVNNYKYLQICKDSSNPGGEC